MSTGPKIFFPTALLKLVRSNLPPHQAVFRVPVNLNKLDIRNMLERIYNIKNITDVRTMVYLGKTSRDRVLGVTQKKPDYKKAIVTMEEDFVFPDPPARDEAKYMPPRKFQSNRPIPRKTLSKLREKKGVDMNSSNTTSSSGNE